jgi:hypothetical protein
MAKNITKVPNGPLIKKKGPYAGSTLKTGGKIKKAQDGFNKVKPGTKQTTPKFHVPESRFVITNDTAKVKPTRWINNPMPPSKDKKEFPMPSEALMDSVSKASVRNIDTSKLMKKKAQNGDSISPYMKKRAAQQLIKEKNIRTRDSILNRNASARGMTREEVRAQQEKDKKKPDAQLEGLQIGKACKRGESKGSCSTGQTNKGESLKDTKRNGGMIKRADGSYSKRGLWDNIRANKGSGKKPTKQMLVQEKKIKAKSKK